MHKFDELAAKTAYQKKVAKYETITSRKYALVGDEAAGEQERYSVESSEEVSEGESSEYDSDGEKIVYVPRFKLQAYRLENQKDIRHTK